MVANPTESKHRNVYPISFVLFVFALYYAPILNFYLPSTKFEAGVPNIGFYELVLFFWVCAVLLDLSQRVLRRTRTSWVILLGIYSFVVIVSLFWSREPYSASNIRDLFFHVLVPFLFGYTATFYISNPLYRRSLVKHAMLGSVILSIVAVVGFVTNYGGNIDEIRSAASLKNPNALAIFLVMSIPLVLYAIREKVLNSKLAYLSLACIVIGVFCTISRKGIITAGVSFCLFFLAIRNYKALLLYVFVIFIVIIVVANIQDIATRFEQKKIDVQYSGKWNMTLVGWDMFVKHPAIGLGYKGYYNEFGKYFKYSGRRKYDAHNSFITVLANYGLIGSIPFFGIFLLPLTKSIKFLLRRPGRGFALDEQAKNATGIAIVIPFMMGAWFAGDLMYMAAVTSVLYVLIAMFCIPAERSGSVPSAVSQGV